MTAATLRHAKLQSNCWDQHTNTQFSTSWMPFLSLNQHCRSTEGMLLPTGHVSTDSRACRQWQVSTDSGMSALTVGRVSTDSGTCQHWQQRVSVLWVPICCSLNVSSNQQNYYRLMDSGQADTEVSKRCTTAVQGGQEASTVNSLAGYAHQWNRAAQSCTLWWPLWSAKLFQLLCIHQLPQLLQHRVNQLLLVSLVTLQWREQVVLASVGVV